MLVGHGVEQGTNSILFVIDREVRCGQDRRFVTTLLEQVSKDEDQIARFLRASGNKHLIFEHLKELR